MFARQAGYVHVSNGEGCQDYADGFYDRQRNIGVVALADGAGSYQHSAEGAKAAVAAVLDHFRTNDAISDRPAFIRMVSQAAAQADPVAMDVGTTLLFAAVTNGSFIAGHIGDGVILMRQNGQFSVLSYPENGEHLWETYLLPCSEQTVHFRFYEGTDAESFLLASDGIASQLYEDDGIGCPACEKLYTWCAQMSADEFHRIVLEHFDGIFAKFSGDDKSLAILRTNT